MRIAMPTSLPVGKVAFLVIVASVLLFFWMVRSVMLPVLVSGLFAILLHPLLAWLERRLAKHASFAPLLVTAGAILLVFLPLAFAVFVVIRFVSDFFSSGFEARILEASEWLARLLARLGGLLERVGIEGSPEKIKATFVTSAQAAGNKLAEALGGLASSTPQLVIGAFLFTVGLYFFLRDGRTLVGRLAELLPFSAPDVEELFASVQAAVKGAVLGSAVTGAVQAGLCTAMLSLLGVPGPFVWGALAFMLSFIPLFGTAPVSAGATLYLFVVGNTVGGIVMGVAGVLIGLSDNIVRPWAQGSQDDMHPLVTLLAIFGGIEAFGFAGVFVGPVVAACALWGLDVYGRSKRE